MTNYNYWAEDSSAAIEHHGILGMKWGQRRYQYEDGSLTPEGRKRYLKNSSFSKEHDIILAPGSKTYRIATNKGATNREKNRIYVALNEKDANKYAGWYSRQLMEDLDIKGPIYQKTYTVSNNTKIASEKKAQEILANSLKTDKAIKTDALKLIDSIRDRNNLRYSQKEYEKMANNIQNGKITKKETDMLTRAIVLKDTKDFQEKYFSELSKQGYDGIIDINDKYHSYYQTKNPAILFNTGKVKVESIKELSGDDIAKICRKEDLKRDIEQMFTDAANMAGILAALRMV